ncbi:MAG: hypothetical protein MK108_10730 [Mariniblastus sp.]|nr:hypothetical protein [Mariniblastus sp.]
MLTKILLGLALLAGLAITPLAMTGSFPAGADLCSCCGNGCLCEDCHCQQEDCQCKTGSESACSDACCTDCCHEDA